jgi:hypothetical protein
VYGCKPHDRKMLGTQLDVSSFIELEVFLCASLQRSTQPSGLSLFVEIYHSSVVFESGGTETFCTHLASCREAGCACMGACHASASV